MQVYAAHSPRLPQAAAVLMLDALAQIAQHARDVDADLALRRDLAAAQAEGKVGCFGSLLGMQRNAGQSVSVTGVHSTCQWLHGWHLAEVMRVSSPHEGFCV